MNKKYTTEVLKKCKKGLTIIGAQAKLKVSFKRLSLLISCVLVMLLITSCGKVVPPIKESHITWDNSTRVKIATGSYARVKELDNGQLIAVYSREGIVYINWSDDSGATWHSETPLIEGDEYYTMTNAEAIQLADKSIIVAANRRVKDNYQRDKYTYGVFITKSTDKGVTWSIPKMIYEAGNEAGIGCWEPALLQLPDGELQCYFANEKPYVGSNNTQEIALLRSYDNGENWTTQTEKVCYASGSRDGMPVPIYQKSTQRILVSIEDNYGHWSALQPSIVYNSLTDNWKNGYVDEKDSRRIHAVPSFDINRSAGAPYLAELKTGELIISYQDRAGREKDNEVLKVRITNELGKPFDRETTPFDIPLDKRARWNSLTVLRDGTVLAVTSTNAYNDIGAIEVYMIKGNVSLDVQKD